MSKLPASLVAQQTHETWPPFLDGRLRLQIFMAISQWGLLRISEIAEMTGESARGDRNWNSAVRHLERLGVHRKQYIDGRHYYVCIDKRHPASRLLQEFGKKLYTLYFELIITWTPTKKRTEYWTTKERFDPATLDLHIFGGEARGRLLHLIAEIRSSPGFVLLQTLGLSHGSYQSINDWKRFGIVATLYPNMHIKKRWGCSSGSPLAWTSHTVYAPEAAQLVDAGVRRLGRRLSCRAESRAF